jgi:hypothetical protein
MQNHTITITEKELNLLSILIEQGMKMGKLQLKDNQGNVVGYMAKECVLLSDSIESQLTEANKAENTKEIKHDTNIRATK